MKKDLLKKISLLVQIGKEIKARVGSDDFFRDPSKIGLDLTFND